MKTLLLLAVTFFVVMEIISFSVYQKGRFQEDVTSTVTASKTEEVVMMSEETIVPLEPFTSQPAPEGSGEDFENFPPPSIEIVKGVTERTIHMGVRQYAWDPSTIRVKKGELVRVIIHNADVKHGLVIPDLGVDEDIPPDGAIVEFMADKIGTFEFFCSVWCGEGHMEMQGKIIIE